MLHKTKFNLSWNNYNFMVSTIKKLIDFVLKRELMDMKWCLTYRTGGQFMTYSRQRTMKNISVDLGSIVNSASQLQSWCSGCSWGQDVEWAGVYRNRWLSGFARLMAISPFSLSAPALCSSFIKRHLTAKHPHSTVDNTKAKTKAAQLLGRKIARVRESLPLLHEMNFFHHSKNGFSR